jgi:hypothetical protein
MSPKTEDDPEWIRWINGTAVERLALAHRIPKMQAQRWLDTARTAFQGRTASPDYRPPPTHNR